MTKTRLISDVVSSKGCRTVYYQNGVDIGSFEVGDDGYYVFWPNTSNQGYWDAYILQAISVRLFELNKSWDDQINMEFTNDKITNV